MNSWRSHHHSRLVARRRALRSARHDHHHDEPPAGRLTSGAKCCGTSKFSSSSVSTSMGISPSIVISPKFAREYTGGCDRSRTHTRCARRLVRRRVGDTTHETTTKASDHCSGIAQIRMTPPSPVSMDGNNSTCSPRPILWLFKIPNVALQPKPRTRTWYAAASPTFVNRHSTCEYSNGPPGDLLPNPAAELIGIQSGSFRSAHRHQTDTSSDTDVAIAVAKVVASATPSPSMAASSQTPPTGDLSS
jgi:hypothetical protein